MVLSSVHWNHLTSVINVRCSGYVWIEPAPVIQMGLNISINCHSTVNCQMAKLYMILNNSHIEDKLLTTINKTTVQLQLHDFRKPYSTVLCYAKCPSKAANMVVCGTQFSAGHPPDSPTNLTCVIYEHSDHLTCAWDAGKYTYINEEKAFPSTAALNISLSKLQGGKLYSIWVQAKNDLGTAHSDQLQVNLEDLVIPATPVITNVKTTDSSAPRTILHWKKQTSMENIYCEERYKALADQTWHLLCTILSVCIKPNLVIPPLRVTLSFSTETPTRSQLMMLVLCGGLVHSYLD
uniref:Fibronectin type-III domain-containing protein n=1 Tax=Chelydra serpentina TaxID=8475 RepID=A0A8C3T830_CHESE